MAHATSVHVLGPSTATPVWSCSALRKYCIDLIHTIAFRQALDTMSVWLPDIIDPLVGSGDIYDPFQRAPYMQQGKSDFGRRFPTVPTAPKVLFPSALLQILLKHSQLSLKLFFQLRVQLRLGNLAPGRGLTRAWSLRASRLESQTSWDLLVGLDLFLWIS